MMYFDAKVDSNSNPEISNAEITLLSSLNSVGLHDALDWVETSYIIKKLNGNTVRMDAERKPGFLIICNKQKQAIFIFKNLPKGW